MSANDDEKRKIYITIDGKKHRFKNNDDIVVVNRNETVDNVRTILLYALALAAALGFNDLIRTIFQRFNIYPGSQIGSKTLYVIIMFSAVLTLAYFTQSKINI